MMLFASVCAKWCRLQSQCAVEILALLLCNAGSILILQPYPFFKNNTKQAGTNFIMPNTSQDQDLNGAMHNFTESSIQDSTDGYMGISYIGIILALISGMASTSQFVIQKLKLLNVDAMLLYFWSSLIGTGLTFIISLCTEELHMNFTWTEVILLAAHCLSNVFTVSVFYAPYFTNVAVITTTLSMVTVFMFIFQKIFLQSILPGPGNWLEILGVILTTAGSIVMSACTACPAKDDDEQSQEGEEVRRECDTLRNDSPLPYRNTGSPLP